jgi:hypothetical protein
VYVLLPGDRGEERGAADAIRQVRRRTPPSFRACERGSEKQVLFLLRYGLPLSMLGVVLCSVALGRDDGGYRGRGVSIGAC